MESTQQVSTTQQPRRQPAWMNTPGAPSRPDHAVFRAKMTKLVEERRRLIEEIKQLQASLRGGDEIDAVEQERKELRQRINELDAERKEEQGLRVNKNDEIAKVRKQKYEINDRLRALQADLGGFSDLKEIDAALNFVMRKMETSGGGLRAERRTVQRLHQLEEAKALLLQRQSLAEAIEEAEEREALLQQEYREIHERIGALNKVYEEEFQNKQTKDKAVRKTAAERTAVWKKCEELRGEVTKINDEMDSTRTEHSRLTAEWDAWCTEARAKYLSRIEAERQERRRRYLEIHNASKMEGKLQRARQRQNPHEVEITACDTLIRYLQDKKTMMQREEEARAKRDAAAAFDVTKAAPAGYVVLNEGKWSKERAGKKVPNKKPQQKTNLSGNSDNKRANAEPLVQHSEDKMRLFELLNEKPPVSLAAIDESIAALHDKLVKFKSHIVTGELQLSSDDDEEVEEEKKNEEDKMTGEEDQKNATEEIHEVEDVTVKKGAMEDEATTEAPITAAAVPASAA